MSRRSGDAPAGQMSLFLPSLSPDRDGEEEALPDPQPDSLPVAQSGIWQVHEAYVFAQTRAGVVILDQHSAHERVLYEETMRSFETGAATSQRLLFPIVLSLPPEQFALVVELNSLFARIGFEMEPAEEHSVRVHALPQPYPAFDGERCLREMLAELAGGSELIGTARTQHQRLALSFACKGSIRSGQQLSPREMGELFDRLFATEQPFRDIHGRPTMVQLSLAELRERFGR